MVPIPMAGVQISLQIDKGTKITMNKKVNSLTNSCIQAQHIDKNHRCCTKYGTRGSKRQQRRHCLHTRAPDFLLKQINKKLMVVRIYLLCRVSRAIEQPKAAERQWKEDLIEKSRIISIQPKWNGRRTRFCIFKAHAPFVNGAAGGDVVHEHKRSTE